MSTYTFIYESGEEEAEAASIEMALTPSNPTHFEITEFYMRFLRACGYAIKNVDQPDINDLAYE